MATSKVTPEVVERDGAFYVGSAKFRTAKAAADALKVFLDLSGALRPAKPEAVKAAARVALARALVTGYLSALAEVPADVVAALGGPDAVKADAVNWVHHLPVVPTGGEWPFPEFPVPARSNWVDGKRK